MKIHKDTTNNRYFVNRLVSYGTVYRVKRIYFKTLDAAKKAV